jgi:CelD/BcsL family acetyltransferase involved in cellulose biosynthesis
MNFTGRTVHIRCFENLDELQPHAAAWDALAAGCVFRSWTWQSTWWRHYGKENGGRSLSAYLAFKRVDERPESLIAVLPCYVDATWTEGRVLRLLGDGEVCSDHLGLLAPSNQPSEVLEALATQVFQRPDWDLLDFTGVDGDDEPTQTFFKSLELGDCATSQLLGERTWNIDLPSTWDEFLALQSKSHRKQLRQMERRVLEVGKAVWRPIDSSIQFGDAWTTLVDLHQRRRKSLGEPGCFASSRWSAFHWDVAQRLLGEGRLRLSTLELDGSPAAAEYHLAGAHATYAYQGGVDPDCLADEPGQLSTICSIKQAIAEGHATFDLLRGDEPYKAHWRATPRQAVRLVAVPPRVWPRLRHQTWRGAKELAHAARQFTGLFT